jgi:hypothetical protein
MAKPFTCPYANNLLEKLTTACKKGKPIFSVSYEEFKNVSVEDVAKILSMTGIFAITRDSGKLRKLIVKKGKPIGEPFVALEQKPKPEPKPEVKVKPKNRASSHNDIPDLIPCTLEEERYIIEQIALVEISKLGKYPKVFIDLDDD